MKRRMKAFRDTWKRFAHALANVQIRILLSIVYFLVLPLFALLYRLGPGRNGKTVSAWNEPCRTGQTPAELAKEW